MNKRLIWLGPVLLVLLAAVIYAGAGRHSRLIQDEQVVWGNPAVAGSAVSDALYGRFYAAVDELRPVVRPVSTVALRLLHGAFTFDRTPYQWGLIFLHAVTGALFFRLLLALFGTAVPALLGSLLFVAHPAATSSVLSLAGYSDVLSLLFSLTALVMARETRSGRPLPIVGTLLAFLLACWSKESALAAAPAILFAAWQARAEQRAHSPAGRGVHPTKGLTPEASVAAGPSRGETVQLIGLGLAAVIVIVLVFRFLSLSALPEHLRLATAVTPITGVPEATRMLLGVGSLATYLRLFLFPLELGYAYDHLYVQGGGERIFHGVIGGLLLAGIVFVTLRTLTRRGAEAGWLLYLLGTTFAASGILVSTGDFASERMLYPVLPGAITVALVAIRSLGAGRFKPGWERVGAVVGLLVVGLFAVRSATRSADYMDNDRLIRAQVATFTKSAVGHFDLGNQYLSQGLWEGAGAEYDKATALRPDYWQAWVNRGGAYFGQNEIGLAMRCYQTAMVGMRGRAEFTTVWGKLHFNRALILMQQNRNTDAVNSLLETAKIYPNHLRARASLGYIYSNAPAYDREALDHLSKAVELETDPDRAEKLRNKITEVKRRRENINSRRGYPEDFMGGGGKEGPDDAEEREPAEPDTAQ
ncbi:MAG: tetratricopeptide repeat protein [Candidatus Eisenbacteria bacterium]|nr:tetratricopeptide repeat protein [Candidatus Eisenbacteria bacterium]